MCHPRCIPSMPGLSCAQVRDGVTYGKLDTGSTLYTRLQLASSILLICVKFGDLCHGDYIYNSKIKGVHLRMIIYFIVINGFY